MSAPGRLGPLEPCSARANLLPICSRQAEMVGRYFLPAPRHLCAAAGSPSPAPSSARAGWRSPWRENSGPEGFTSLTSWLDGGFADLSLGPAANDERDPDAMATVYWQLVCQERSAWTLELDLRPIPRKILRAASISRVKRRAVFTPGSPTQAPNHPAGTTPLVTHFHVAAGVASRPLPRHP